MVKFWSKPFLICFAMGVVTGIVLEFQIGMNWSEYSRFVGDVFGAPLAMEALLAFFLEATFIGLWVFGWDRLPKGIHLACIWCVAIGTNLSAYFIITANSWMQHPVGFTYNAERGRAELTDIGAVLTNKVAIAAYPHIVAGAALSAAAVVIGISAWHLARRAHIDVMRTSLRFGFAAAVLAGIGTTITGDFQGKVMTEVQPMKMAAAEALWDSKSEASFSVFTIGTRDATHEVFSVRVPYLLSFISHGDIHATVEGINDVQATYERSYGPGDYRPHIPTTYWSFRYMIGLGAVTTALGLLGLWLTRRGRLPDNPWFWRALIWTTPLAILGNGFGWVFTEMGRQPWVVFGEMFTRDALSPVTPAWDREPRPADRRRALARPALGHGGPGDRADHAPTRHARHRRRDRGTRQWSGGRTRYARRVAARGRALLQTLAVRVPAGPNRWER